MKKILNLGCGYNYMKEAWNVDINIDCEPDQVINLEEKLPFKDNSFNKIVSNECFEHIRNVNQLTKECRRVLKPDGKIEITVPYHGLIKNILIAMFRFDNHYSIIDNGVGHLRFFTRKTLIMMVRHSAGFRIDGFIYSSGKIFPSLMTVYATNMKRR